MRNTFTPYEGLKLTRPTSPYVYTILDVSGDTLKCRWINITTDETGYCEMNLWYAEKVLTSCEFVKNNVY